MMDKNQMEKDKVNDMETRVTTRLTLRVQVEGPNTII